MYVNQATVIQSKGEGFALKSKPPLQSYCYLSILENIKDVHSIVDVYI